VSLLEVGNLTKTFPQGNGLWREHVPRIHALRGVSFSVDQGEIVGVVGESGCGKSTLGKALLRLIEPTSGSIRFEGREITSLTPRQFKPLRRRMQIIFQDPYGSLNPRLTVAAALREVVRFHGVVPKSDVNDHVAALIAQVGLRAETAARYPHEMSGGQRQRVNIARAVAVRPKLLVADEPVSALDVSIRAQILNLLLDLKDRYALTMLLISHDLSVVEHLCDRVLVMYLGHIVEDLPARDVARSALHPYTQALLAAVPVVDPTSRRTLRTLHGEVPSPLTPPGGCPFVSRCPIAEPRCASEMPPMDTVKLHHRVACWARGTTAQ
jgi:oligopeptide/dipeptide ABC transporter ATP-binding protein